jgi:hypothetical protein
MEMTKEKRDLLITSLYDKYGKGEISANQRELLIQKINDKFYTEAVAIMTEKAKSDKKECDEKSEEPCTNKKYDKLKKSIEKKFEDGEITEEVRDKLLEKAKEKFCPDTEE